MEILEFPLRLRVSLSSHAIPEDFLTTAALTVNSASLPLMLMAHQSLILSKEVILRIFNNSLALHFSATHLLSLRSKCSYFVLIHASTITEFIKSSCFF